MSFTLVSVKVKVFVDNSGVTVNIPGLLMPDGVLGPLVDYLKSHSHDRSPSWMKKVVRSVQKFLEYVQANKSQLDSHLLFANFAHKLYKGTYNPRTGDDPSKLYWNRCSTTEARNILTDLGLFFDWLAEGNSAASQVNPRVATSRYDRQWDTLALQYRRDKRLLGHLWSNAEVENGVGRKLRARRSPATALMSPPAFPDDRFDELLSVGFRSRRGFDYRGMLITLLQNGAGFRVSEPFHLFIEDVIPDPFDPRMALVRIHHPSDGAAPPGWCDSLGRIRTGTRQTYLAERFGLVPRTALLDKRHAGWKGGMHDGKYYKQARWFRPEYGVLFLQIWYKYLRQVAVVERSHPFAFVNLSGESSGEMYTISMYDKAHQRAVRRIGLCPKKYSGTTDHGHRHAYGQRLKGAGISKEYIRRFIHHSSLESQEVYTQPTPQEMDDALEKAASLMSQTSRPELSKIQAQLGLDEFQ